MNNKDCYLDLFDNIFDDNTEIVFLNNTISNIPNIEENEMYEILNYYFKNTNQKEMLNICLSVQWFYCLLGTIYPELSYCYLNISPY